MPLGHHVDRSFWVTFWVGRAPAMPYSFPVILWAALSCHGSGARFGHPNPALRHSAQASTRSGLPLLVRPINSLGSANYVEFCGNSFTRDKLRPLVRVSKQIFSQTTERGLWLSWHSIVSLLPKYVPKQPKQFSSLWCRKNSLGICLWAMILNCPWKLNLRYTT